MKVIDETKAKFRHLNFKIKHDYLTIENVVLAMAIVLCLMWTYQSIMAMSRNWELSDTLTREKEELALLTLETDMLELENDYYRTTEYQELLAKKYADKQNPGEKMVVMPANSETAKMKHAATEETVSKLETEEKTNFEQWMNYLFPSY